MNDILEAALCYSEFGWSTLPVFAVREDGSCSCGKKDCENIGKHPRSPHGYKDATTDQREIRRFCRLPHTNLGIATGSRSDLIILDVDPRNGGAKSLQELEGKYGPLPATVIAQSGGPGGEHIYFKNPHHKTKKNNPSYPGLDLLGEGAFAIAAPSNHKSGKKYAWKHGCAPNEIGIAHAPGWLLSTFSTQKTQTEPPKSERWHKGVRNENLFNFGCSLRARGAESEVLLAKLSEKNRAACEPPLTHAELTKIASSVTKYEAGASKGCADESASNMEWAEPGALPSKEIEVPSFRAELIPSPLRDYVEDTSERMQCAPEMIAGPLLVCLGSAIGRRLSVRPKQHDDWTEFPNLWGAVVAPSSAMKTPAMGEALRFIRKLENDAKRKFLEEFDAFEKRKKTHLEENPKVAFGESPPTRKRFLVNDGTTEKIGEILSTNPQGLLVFRDELYGLLMTLEKAGREGDRQFFLEGFNGKGSYTFDRISRGTLEIPALCLSLLGGIQPDRLSEYFETTIKNGSSGDGFLARFQILIYPPRSSDWQLIDRPPDFHAYARVCEIFDKISNTDFTYGGYQQSKFEDAPHAHFSPKAQEIFYAWLGDLEDRARSGSIESSALEAHLSKYRRLMPVLSLIFHVLDFADAYQSPPARPMIEVESARLAIRWCEFLESHAKKIYADASRPLITAIHAVAEKITSGKITDGMTVRNLYRKEWSSLRIPKTVNSALAALQDLNWINILEVRSPSGQGAPSEIIKINPAVFSRTKNNNEQKGAFRYEK